MPFIGKNQSVRLYYFKEKKYSPFPFPENTHGHLYYCTPSQDRPPLSGSFRFRVLPSTPDHPKSFAEGNDLLRPDGRPWGLSLYGAIHTSGYAPLVQKLLDENLLDAYLLNTIAGLPRTNLRFSTDVLYTLSDPFSLSLSQSKHITVITEDHVAHFRFLPFIDLQLNQHPFTGIFIFIEYKNKLIYFYIYLGTVLARFEKSTLPEHMHRRAVVLRILDILSPINCVILDYDFNVQMPEAGQLNAKRKLSGRYGRYHPWSLDISDGTSSAAKCLRQLFPPESTPSSPLKYDCIL